MFDMTITGELVFLNKKSNILNKFLEKNNNSPNNTEICKIKCDILKIFLSFFFL